MSSTISNTRKERTRIEWTKQVVKFVQIFIAVSTDLHYWSKKYNNLKKKKCIISTTRFSDGRLVDQITATGWNWRTNIIIRTGAHNQLHDMVIVDSYRYTFETSIKKEREKKQGIAEMQTLFHRLKDKCLIRNVNEWSSRNWGSLKATECWW